MRLSNDIMETVRFCRCCEACEHARNDMTADASRARRKAGFTLVEMLAALIVLMLLTGIMVMGTQMASKLYRSSTFESQCAMLSSTIDNALSDPLRFMKYKNGKYVIIYQNNDPKGKIVDSDPKIISTDGKIYLTGYNSTGDTTLTLKVLNESVYGDCLVTLDSSPESLVPGTDGNVTVEYDITSKNDASLTHHYKLTCKPTSATKTS